MQAHDGELTIARHGAEVRAALVLPGRAPAAVLAAFTEPELLKRWWPGELTAELVPGGVYQVRFAQLEQTMSGVVEVYEPGERLAFVWGWEHEPELAGRYLVTVTVRPEGGGTRLDLLHAPRPGVEVTPRDGEVEGHLEGWEFFLPLLPLVV